MLSSPVKCDKQTRTYQSDPIRFWASLEVLHHQIFIRFPPHNNPQRIYCYTKGTDYVRVTWHLQGKDRIGELLQHARIPMSRRCEDT